MNDYPQHWLGSLPALSDESVIEILDFLQSFVVAFESFYGSQIRHYYDQRSCNNFVATESSAPIDDPPF